MFKEKDSLTNQNTIKLLSNTLEIDQTISEKVNFKKIIFQINKTLFISLAFKRTFEIGKTSYFRRPK